jgi:hypothetical protein
MRGSLVTSTFHRKCFGGRENLFFAVEHTGPMMRWEFSKATNAQRPVKLLCSFLGINKAIFNTYFGTRYCRSVLTPVRTSRVKDNPWPE